MCRKKTPGGKSKMKKKVPFRRLMKRISKILLFFVFVIMCFPKDGRSEIIWSGDYETGNASQWHNGSTFQPQYTFIPKHGRPPAAGGDGSLFSVVTNPVRQGRYAAKFTVLNSKNGKEPNDCDVPYPTCSRRRTEMNAITALCGRYNAMPYLSERWISASYFIPQDWNNGGSGFGIHVLQIKPYNDGAGPMFTINIRSGAWRIEHNWSNVVNPQHNNIPWQQRMYYDSNYPVFGKSPLWNDGVAHFPDPKTSRAALADLNKGGWTDWIIHIKYDARGAKAGGQGFLKLWKRVNNEKWIHVLDIKPGVTSRGGMTFDHGIGFNSPPKSGSKIGNFPNNGGFGIAAGMYLDKNQVWGLSNNRVLYQDNIKIGSERASFAKMSPDGSLASSSPSSPSSQISPPSISITPTSSETSAQIIIDNRNKSATSQTGTWPVSGASSPYGTDSVWSRDGTTFTWHFSPPKTSNYEMSMWWTPWSSRSKSIPVNIEHAGGTTRVTVNQTANGGKWNSLGKYRFESGKNYRITITSQPGPSSTCADAVRFLPVN
jgi:hypothetical protein